MPAAVITLYQPPSAWGIPSLSPFCTKVETYLRMVDLPYRTRGADPRKTPKGKVPWIDDDGRSVSDSSDIIDHLNARLGDPLDRALDHSQRALALLARRTSHNNDRPLLAGEEDPKAKLTRLLDERKPLYKALADLRIQTSELTPQETAYGIMESARVFFSKMKR